MADLFYIFFFVFFCKLQPQENNFLFYSAKFVFMQMN